MDRGLNLDLDQDLDQNGQGPDQDLDLDQDLDQGLDLDQDQESDQESDQDLDPDLKIIFIRLPSTESRFSPFDKKSKQLLLCNVSSRVGHKEDISYKSYQVPGYYLLQLEYSVENQTPC